MMDRKITFVLSVAVTVLGFLLLFAVWDITHPTPLPESKWEAEAAFAEMRNRLNVDENQQNVINRQLDIRITKLEHIPRIGKHNPRRR